MVNDRKYGCATAKDRGTCASRLLVSRQVIEERLLEGVKQDLLSEEAYQYCLQQARELLRTAAPDLTATRAELHQAERERDNIMAAIRAGIVTDTTKGALVAAEQAVSAAVHRLEEGKAYRPDEFLPRARDLWRATVAKLEAALEDVPAARQALSELLGDRITIARDEAGIYAELPADGMKISVVAGAGYAINRPRTKRLIRLD